MRKKQSGDKIKLKLSDLVETPEGAVLTVEELFQWTRRIARMLKRHDNALYRIEKSQNERLSKS